jgi:Ca-activated chloride channel homolog
MGTMKRRTILLAIVGAICTFGVSLPAGGQGVLVVERHSEPIPLPRPIPWPRPRPRPEPPPISYRIKELTAQARIVDQIARVQVTQSFVNTGSRQMEVSFVFPLPADGAIDQLTLLVDGKEFPGEILPAPEARRIYEGYVRRNQDPALLEWMGYGMFKTSVFPVPAGAERKVTVQYSQLLRKEGQLVDFLFPLATAKYTSQPVEKVLVEVSIESSEKLKSIYSPTHGVDIQRRGERNAQVRWELEQAIPSTDFRLFFDSDPGKVGASLVSYRPSADEEGFFLMLASPEIPQTDAAEIARKTVVFVVDRSGSMSGQKMTQAKEALRFVLNNLREGDLFNIVVYDGRVESYKPELQRFDNEARQEALGYVEGIYAGGSTNIDGALEVALKMIQDDQQPNFVIFLTDGLPTTGEQNEAKIVANARQRNPHRARILNLGVGYDVNSRLLDRLGQENRGSSHYVRPDDDIEQHVSNLYRRISSPVMTDVTVEFLVAEKGEDGASRSASAEATVNRVYPREVNDLFAGEQLVLVGRYRAPADIIIRVRGKVGGEEQTLEFPARLVESSSDSSHAFAEKLWAVRRIGEIIDELDLKGRNEELIEELVALSTKHGVLTPYTSFLADENRRGDLASLTDSRREVGERLESLSQATGQSGFVQRAEKQRFRQAQSLAPNFGATPIITSEPRAAPSGLAQGPSDGGRLAGIPSRRSARPQAVAGLEFRDLATDAEVATDAVQVVGRETLYRRGTVWIAANARDIDPEKHRDQLTPVKRFSDEYFQLLSKTTPAENAILAGQKEGEQLLVRLQGHAYLIE